VIGHRWGMLTSLEGLAWVAGSCGQLERASLLLGAGAALSRELGTSLMPYWQAHHDACEAAARGGLDAARYRACWEEGFALGRGQQVAAALEDTVPAGRRAPTASAVHDEGELSTRELEVARLVANGLSNPRDRRRPVRVGGDGQDARVPHPREARLGVSRAARELGRRPRPRSTHPGRPVGVWPQIIAVIGHLADDSAPAEAQYRHGNRRPMPRRHDDAHSR
jgi:hypothetical protein